MLPFRNLGAEPDHEYFADGLAEELITALTKIERLRVAAKASAFTFKGRNAELREIGARLNVETVLSGTVRRSGNRLRVACRLTSVADGSQIWSERYDREMADVFALQDDITRAIVETLKVALGGSAAADAPVHRQPRLVSPLPEGPLLLGQAIRRRAQEGDGGVPGGHRSGSAERARVRRAGRCRSRFSDSMR